MGIDPTRIKDLHLFGHSQQVSVLIPAFLLNTDPFVAVTF